jgi:hypothetical protein
MGGFSPARHHTRPRTRPYEDATASSCPPAPPRAPGCPSEPLYARRRRRPACARIDETCPISTEGGTRRVQLVREGGGRGGETNERRRRRRREVHGAAPRVLRDDPRPARVPGAPPHLPRTKRTRRVPPPRTNRTRRVPPPRTNRTRRRCYLPAERAELSPVDQIFTRCPPPHPFPYASPYRTGPARQRADGTSLYQGLQGPQTTDLKGLQGPQTTDLKGLQGPQATDPKGLTGAGRRRLGANDDLMRGRSTFLVEMNDVSRFTCTPPRSALSLHVPLR